jgi:Ser/Thr protein kinase RdoA (MazF antagonist)
VENRGSFDALSPALVLEAVEAGFGMTTDGRLWPYSSYVNRVYGLSSESGEEFVVKFYRPGRWSEKAILEEHEFLLDCAAAELPVVAPCVDADGSTLPAVELELDEGSELFFFALFPKRGGRSFDAETDSDWLRLGSLAGRLHQVGAGKIALERPKLGSALARKNLSVVLPLVHPEFSQEFSDICLSAIENSAQVVDSLPQLRIHGDLHRGNILDRAKEGLSLLDFDDMVTGPAVQDLWLLLPGHADDCGRELSLLVDGYSEFRDLDWGSIAAIETLRFYRMIHFLAWRSLQRDDAWFKKDYPDWGTRAFWIRELEDMREQSQRL